MKDHLSSFSSKKPTNLKRAIRDIAVGIICVVFTFTTFHLPSYLFVLCYIYVAMPSVLWCCWLGGRKGSQL